MPTRLRGQRLEVTQMTGEVWLEAAPSAYAFGLKADVEKWLDTLGRGAEDMTVAWSRSRLIWMVAYSIRNVPPDRLLETFLASGDPNYKPAIRSEKIGGKRVTVVRVLGYDPDYLLVHDGFLFHLPIVPKDIAEELIAQL